MQKRLQFSKSVVAMLIAFVIAMTGSLLAVIGMQKSSSGSNNAGADLNVSSTADFSTACTDTNHIAVETWADVYAKVDAKTTGTFCFGHTQENLGTAVDFGVNDPTYKTLLSDQIINGYGRTFTMKMDRDRSYFDSDKNGFLFQTIENGAEIHNMNIEYSGSYRSYDNYGKVYRLGFIADTNNGLIKDVKVTMMADSKFVEDGKTDKWCNHGVGGFVAVNEGTGRIINPTIDIAADAMIKSWNDGGWSTGGYTGDTEQYIGGICGINNGTIQGATLDIKGSIRAETYDTSYHKATNVGGVAGKNNASGKISGILVKNASKDKIGWWTTNTGNRQSDAWVVAGNSGVAINTALLVDSSLKDTVNYTNWGTQGGQSEHMSFNYFDSSAYDVSFDDAGIKFAIKGATDTTQIYWNVSNGIDATGNAQNSVDVYTQKAQLPNGVYVGLDDLRGKDGVADESGTIAITTGKLVDGATVDGGYTGVYDGQEHSASVTYTSSIGSDLTGLQPAAITATDVTNQTVEVKAAGTAEGNVYYAYATAPSATLNITARPLNVTINQQTFGLFDENMTATVSADILDGDDFTVSSDKGAIVNGKDVTFGNADTYTITVDAGTNYAVSYANGQTVTVNPAKVNFVGGGFDFAGAVGVDANGNVTQKNITFGVKTISANASIVSVMHGDTELVADSKNIKEGTYNVTLTADGETITTKFANDVYTVDGKEYEYGEKATVTIPEGSNTVLLNDTVVAYGNAGSKYTFTVRGNSVITFENTTISSFTINYRNAAGNIIFTETGVTGATIEEYLATKDPNDYAAKGGFELFRTFASWKAVAVDAAKGIYDAIPQFTADDAETAVQNVTITYHGNTDETITADFNSVVTLDAPNGEEVYWTVNEEVVHFGSSYTFSALQDYDITFSKDKVATDGVILKHEVDPNANGNDDVFMTGTIGDDLVAAGYKFVLTVKNDASNNEYAPAVVLSLQHNQFINGVDLEVLGDSKTGNFTATLYGVKTVEGVETEVVLGTYTFTL